MRNTYRAGVIAFAAAGAAGILAFGLVNAAEPVEPQKMEAIIHKTTKTVTATATATVTAQPSATPTVYVTRTAKAVSRGSSRTSGSVWDRLAQCESGGNWQINTGNGYYGGLQFSLSSWRGVGGSGYPHQASREEQIKRGELLKASGGWGHWPACSSKLGLR